MINDKVSRFVEGDWYMSYPSHVTGLILYTPKTLVNQRFSDVFRGYRKRPVAWNGLTDLSFRVQKENSASKKELEN